MKRILTTTILTLVMGCFAAYSQVGINTETPRGIFHIDAKNNTPATGTPTITQLRDDAIFTTGGNLGLGVIPDPNAKLDVEAQLAYIKFRNLATAPTNGGLNILAHTTSDGNVYTTPFNNRMVSPAVASADSTILIDNLKFTTGLVTIISNNACGSSMVASFTFGLGTLSYVSSIAKDVPGQATIIPIPGNGAGTAGYVVKFPGAAPCASDGGNATQFDFTFRVSDVTAGAANFKIINNGNTARTYTLSIVRL